MNGSQTQIFEESGLHLRDRVCMITTNLLFLDPELDGERWRRDQNTGLEAKSTIANEFSRSRPSLILSCEENLGC